MRTAQEKAMKCFMCKETIQNEATTFMEEVDKTIIIVKNVLSQVCTQCSEVTCSNDVAKILEKMTELLRKLITETAVTNYHDNVAQKWMWKW